MRRRRLGLVLVAAVGLVGSVDPALAHAGSLNLSSEPAPIPDWVYAMTGGAIVALSFLFTSLVTDPELVHVLRDRERPVRVGLARLLSTGARIVGVVGLTAVLVVGFIGPQTALANAGVLLVWVAWWAGFTMSVYVLGNTWPWLNPWRTIVSVLPRMDRHYPARFGLWPAVLGLLALVFVEVVTPLADDPRLLASVVLVYTGFTLLGAVVFGPDAWFEKVDPVSRVFHYYGTLGFVQWDDGISVQPPSAALSRGDLLEGRDEVAFVITLLWVTTYDGLVSTPVGTAPVRAAVSVGVPALVAYAVLLLVGFGLFLGAFWAGAVGIRRIGKTYVSTPTLARRFAPTLLPIAAGYHLAHFLGYFIELLPALGRALVAPLSAPLTVPVVSLPGWFGGLELGFVVVGHVVAVWAAHGTAFDLFPGRIQPIRSQYPLVFLMIAYTITSLWIIAQPFTAPPFV